MTSTVQGTPTGIRDTWLPKIFLFLRRFKPVRERVTMGEFDDHVEREHLARYKFAQHYCAGKRVADIACGTGYGTRMLAEVASSAHGFDKERLCGNEVIDLEKQSWSGEFDVVVSFETIEHLANPEFFLENARKTAKLLLVSTPIGELRGYNPYHKQVWNFEQFKAFVERYFECRYFYQVNDQILDTPPSNIRFVIAVGVPK